MMTIMTTTLLRRLVNVIVNFINSDAGDSYADSRRYDGYMRYVDDDDKVVQGLTSGCPMSLEASSSTEWTAGEAVVNLW